MQVQGSGSIINISSTNGHEGAAGASVYAGSKHVVEGIIRSVAREIAPSGIRVNGVGPRSDGHRHAGPFHRHAAEQGGPGDQRSNLSRRTGSPPLKGVSGYARFHSANRAALP